MIIGDTQEMRHIDFSRNGGSGGSQKFTLKLLLMCAFSVTL